MVGAGRVVDTWYLPALVGLGWSAVFVDLDVGRAGRLARRLGARGSSADSLAGVRLHPDDVVVVATPPEVHAAVVMEALRAGAVKVLVEKPPFVQRSDLDEVLLEAGRRGAAVRSSFGRRAWPAIAFARRNFGGWGERWGSLERAAIVEGSPFAWKSAATAARGVAGLAPITLDELPHTLDALFHIAGWKDVNAYAWSATESPWHLSARLELSPSGERAVRTDLRWSRTAALANSLSLGFQRAEVVIEMSPVGGVLARAGEDTEILVGGPQQAQPVPEIFAALLRGVAGEDGADALVVDVADWRGPLEVIDAVRAAAAQEDAP